MTTIIHHEPLPGGYLSDAIEDAIALAAGHNLPVRFIFNGVEATVTKWTRSAEVVASFERQWKKSQEAYDASPAARAARECQAAQVARLQQRHDALVGNLSVAVRDEALLVQWLADYADPADDTRVHGRDFARVADVLEAAGYVRKDALGLPREEYTDPRVLARWLIGQAIDQLRSGLPPHPGLMERFAADYRRASQANRAT